MKNAIIVTRHAALVEYLREEGIVASADARIIAHATEDDVRGKHVVGVLPMHLAALAESVTIIPLNTPAELRGTELSLPQIREFAGETRTFVVLDITEDSKNLPAARQMVAETGGAGSPYGAALDLALDIA